jgi:hypothetical protein
MADLFFPQLGTGCLVQYPLKRTKSVHTAINEMADGSALLSADPGGSLLHWDLTYAGISVDEVAALQDLFDAARGRLRAFTFPDPLSNLLSTTWQYSPLIQVNGSTYTNTGSSPAELSQTLPLPASYQFCFSLSAESMQAGGGSIVLIRRGPSVENRKVMPLGGIVFSSGFLADPGAGFTVAVELQPGQTVDLSATQLEIQATPSPFRGTSPKGGVYTNAHWALDELLFSATAPNAFSAKLQIEAHV